MDKLKKIIYIVSGTLSIMLMIFFLMHKVGLCASVNPPNYSTGFPLPYGVGSDMGYGDFPLTDSILQACIDKAFNVHANYFSNGYSVLVHEVDSDYIIFNVCGGSSIFLGPSYSAFPDFTTSGMSIGFPRNGVVRVKYTLSTSSVSSSYSGSSNSEYFCNLGNSLSSLPTGGYYVPKNTEIYAYPVYVSDGYNLSIDGTLVFGSLDSGINFEGGDVTALPNFDDLIGVPDSSDTTDSLFDKLKGWLSTINGNIFKGFKNLEENLTSFFKPYLDNIKGFFDWVVEAPNPDIIQGAWNNTDIGCLVNYVSGLGNTLKSLLGNGAEAPDSLSFNCSITLLHHVFPFTIDFGWYQSIRTQFLTVFLTFFYVGTFLYFIKSIPSFINGVSGSFNNFTQSGGGSDD